MKFIRSWGPAVIWMVIIFAFSSRQRIEVSPEYVLNFLFFKTLHVIEYAILYVFFVRALGGDKKKAFLLTVLYAMSDELHQTFVPTREGKVRDVIIDAIGASLAWISIVKLLPTLPKKLQKSARSWLAI